MNFYYEIEDSIDDDEVSRKPQIVINKKFIIAILAILFFVVLIILLSSKSDPNSKYYKMEEELVSSAKKYVQENMSSTIDKEIYLDSMMLGVGLDATCNKVSGVFYDNKAYTPYLKCDNYESKVLDNNSETITLYGDEILFLARGISFYDPGYNSTGEVEVLGDVGTTEGVYNLYYYDNINRTFIVRKIVIINNEELKKNYPELKLNGSDVIYIKKNDVFNDEGATATDLIDGDISNKIITYGEINTNINGKQRIVYSVTNSRGLTNTIERIVNVIDSDVTIYADYVIEPSTKVNKDVIITLSIYGDIYDHVTLPSGDNVTGNIINYKVSENGKYKFVIYDKIGKTTIKEIEIDNIDKEPPKAICDAVIYNGYTKIDVTSTSNKPISMYEYQVNNMTVKKVASSSYKVNNTSVSSASVVIEDSVGNKNKVTCDVMSYNTWKLDYSKMYVYLIDKNNNIVKSYSLEDYLKGVVYLSLIDIDYNQYTSSQLQELYKTFFILKKAELFNTGKYSVFTKQLVYPINETKYCDVHYGCKSVNSDGKSFFIANDIDNQYDSSYNLKYDKLDDKILEIMNKAYNDTKKEVTVNRNFDDVLVNFNSSYTQITNAIKNTIISDVLSNKTYREIISTRFTNYKIYNINNYASKYAEVLKIESYYYWPIGSTYAADKGIFSGTPESTEILFDYGASNYDNKIHNGIGIRGECGKTKVIASKDGKVSKIGHSDEYGDYVIITHDNGVSMVYGSLLRSSITVSVGSFVKKGQNIGYVGSTNNTCMLYFEVHLNNSIVNPNEYVSISNSRPVSGNKIIYVEGGSVKRSVCLTLLASGFSMDATAGIMANIQRESNFNLSVLGDNGTSIGLCQWHKGRYTNLSNFCGNKIYTTDCQLRFMLHELMNNYKTTYSYVIGNYSAYEIANQFCFYYEVPAAKVTSCPKRGEVAKSIFIPYVQNNCN